jgi:hypothetical protein
MQNRVLPALLALRPDSDVVMTPGLNLCAMYAILKQVFFDPNLKKGCAMAELSESGKAIALAKKEIVAYLSAQESCAKPAPSPREIIERIAPDFRRDPYRAAITSLIASGELIASPDWKLSLQQAHSIS